LQGDQQQEAIGTKRKLVTARMLAPVWMQATTSDASKLVGMKGTIGPPTQLTPAKAGMLAKVVKPAIACREVNYSKDTVKVRNDSSIMDNRNIMDVISSMTARTDGRKVSNSREQQQ
jgi:hypothetical protein